MINQLYGIQDNIGNEVTQWETNDAGTYGSSRFTPDANETGYVVVRLNSVNTSNQAQAVHARIVRYKSINGVASVAGAQQDYNNSDQGMNTADFVVTTSGSDVVINLTGVAGATVRHDLHVFRQSSRLKG